MIIYFVMNHIPDLIKDLALILAVAGVVALLFKRLKQPLVLGYIVAGFLASPHMPYTPSVKDIQNVNLWAEIGVIVLLFTLGLDFSFKKIVKMGGAPVIAATVIIFSMMALGTMVGHLFGWSNMDAIYLGGMLAMSSTTIIYKAFQDMGVLQQKFAGLVLSVLILEDILAIVLMVVLSTLAMKHTIEGEEMFNGIIRLVFFLILWFVVGLYLIPTFLRKSRKWINDEILLIVSLALCFSMAVLAVHSGFSAAFGAFVVGSILAETVEAEHIEKLIAPVKDLFGAIFFVSVGMVVDPHILVEYAWPIAAVVLTIILGQGIFGTLGYLGAGQSLREALKCGFSMTQIGEFAFIIASLGLSLGVTSPFLYPIVVAVSVITTFTTPYMIRLSDPAFRGLSRMLPEKWLTLLERNVAGGVATVNHESNWRRLIMAVLRIVVIYSILSIAVIVISLNIFLPFLRDHFTHWWANGICGITTVLCISPFLRAIMIKKNHSIEYTRLWNENPYNRIPLAFLILARVILSVSFVFYIVRYLVPFADALLLAFACFLVALMVFSRRLKLQSIHMEQVFMHNLRSRDIRAEVLGQQSPRYAHHLLTRDVHLADFEVPAATLWAGKTLAELNLGKKYGIHIASILRGEYRINIPKGSDCLFPYDRIQVIGSDEQLSCFSQVLESQVHEELLDYGEREMTLKRLFIDDKSVFLGKTIKNSDIRERYHCLVVGWEAEGGMLESPDVDRVFQVGDVLWIVGEPQSLRALV